MVGLEEEHLAEGHGGSHRPLEALDAHDIALLDPVLLAARLDDRVHRHRSFRLYTTKPQV